MDLFKPRHVLLILLILLLVFGANKLKAIGREIGGPLREMVNPLPFWIGIALLAILALAVAFAIHPVR